MLKDSRTTCSEYLIEFIFHSSYMDSYSYFYRNHTSSTYDDEWTITKRGSGIVVTVSGTGASLSIYLRVVQNTDVLELGSVHFTPHLYHPNDHLQLFRRLLPSSTTSREPP